MIQLQVDLLREQLRVATAPSRALDEALFAWAGARLCCEWESILGCYIKVWWFKERKWINVPRFTASLDTAMTLLPDGWWIYRMAELRSPIIFKNDKHTPIGKYFTELQHDDGGLLMGATGATLALAFCRACVEIEPIIEPKGMPALLFPPGFMGSRSWP